jgi:hypothetical protein
MDHGEVALSDPVLVDRHLYYTEDKSRVVVEGDPAGHTLWAAPGQVVSRGDAERLGALVLLGHPGGVPDGMKQAPTPANKQAPTPANKSR